MQPIPLVTNQRYVSNRFLIVGLWLRFGPALCHLTGLRPLAMLTIAQKAQILAKAGSATARSPGSLTPEQWERENAED